MIDRISRPGSCGTSSGPVLGARIGDGRRHDAEILGAAGIRQHEEDVTAFFQLVLDTGLAGRNEHRFGIGRSAGRTRIPSSRDR